MILAPLLYAFGGGFGAVLRHWVGQQIPSRFPLATLAVNVLGSFALGLGLGLWPDGTARHLLLGVTGGFTTFSSFACQTLDLYRNRSVTEAGLNILLNLCLCLVALWLGRFMAG